MQVIEKVRKVTGCSANEAMVLVSRMDDQGEAVVAAGSALDCGAIASELRNEGLHVSLSPCRSTPAISVLAVVLTLVLADSYPQFG